MKRIAALSAMLGVVIATSSSSPSVAAQADAPSFHLESTIAFTSTRDNPAGEIYLMNPDGTNPRRLTVNADGDAFPVLSGDGKKLIFDSTRLTAGTVIDGKTYNNISDLFLMNPVGSGQTLLTRGSSATWSDGKKVAFHASASYYASGGLVSGTPIRTDPGSATTDSDIFVVNVVDLLAGVKQPRNLTNSPTKIDDDADWSGESIVYTAHDVGDEGPNYPRQPFVSNSAEIYVMNADGSGTEQLTNNEEEERGPAWSPDGSRIVYSCRIGGGVADTEICVMDADGTHVQQLTDNSVPDLTATWSPSGEQIVFHRRVVTAGVATTQLGVVDMPTNKDDCLRDVAPCDLPWAQLTSPPGSNLLASWGELRVRAYEVWAIDQSNSPGVPYGGTLHVWDGDDLERDAESAASERIDLGGAVAAVCDAKTGAKPVRPHMLAFNASQTHAVVSFVASGHVVFMDAATRAPVDCIRTSIGSTGLRQVHFAVPAPDETYVAVANQNGKLFERIRTDYATNTFTLETWAEIDLATCVTPNGFPCESAVLRPDNAPICPVIDSTSQYSFVTLRGGGLFVVDSQATPMKIVAEYDRATVHPNGCLGAEVPSKMYIDSGGGTPANVFEADLYAFPVTGFSPLNPPNTPAPKVVFSEDVHGADTHGATLTKHLDYLWVADRGRNFHFVVDTATDEVVNRIPLVPGPSSDPTPDLLFTSPNGSHVFMSLRGPNPLTADPHVSTGATPGVGVMKVLAGGRDGAFEGVARVTNVDAGGVERADVHALAVRVRR